MFSKSIKLIFGVLIVTAQQHVHAQKVNDTNINLNKALETALQFIIKDTAIDTTFIKNLLMFLNNVKVTYNDINYRRRHVDSSPAKLLTYIIQNFIDTLLKLDHTELQYVLTIISDELKKYQFQGTDDHNFRDFIARSLNRVAEMSVTSLRYKLKTIGDRIEQEMLNKYKNKLIYLINASFDNKIMVYLKNIFVDLEIYRNKTEKNLNKLEELVRNVIQSILNENNKNPAVLAEVHAHNNSNIDTQHKKGENQMVKVKNNSEIDTSDLASKLGNIKSEISADLASSTEVEFKAPKALQRNKQKSRGYRTSPKYNGQSYKQRYVEENQDLKYDSNDYDRSKTTKFIKRTSKRHRRLRNHNTNSNKSLHQFEQSLQDMIKESSFESRLPRTTYDEKHFRTKALSNNNNKKHKIQDDDDLDVVTWLTHNDKQIEVLPENETSITESPASHDDKLVDESININDSSKTHKTPKIKYENLFTRIEKLVKEFNLLKAQVSYDSEVMKKLKNKMV